MCNFEWQRLEIEKGRKKFEKVDWRATLPVFGNIGSIGNESEGDGEGRMDGCKEEGYR